MGSMTMPLFWGEGAKGVPLFQDYFNDPKQIVMGQSMWLLPIIILVIIKNLWPPMNYN
jgi:hypothetical protein